MMEDGTQCGAVLHNVWTLELFVINLSHMYLGNNQIFIVDILKKMEKLECLSLLFCCNSPCFDTLQWLFKHLALILDIMKETWVIIINSENKWKKLRTPKHMPQ